MNTARITGTVVTLPACALFGMCVGGVAGGLLGMGVALVAMNADPPVAGPPWSGSLLECLTIGLFGAGLGAVGGLVAGVTGRILGGPVGWAIGGVLGSAVVSWWLGPLAAMPVLLAGVFGFATGYALHERLPRFALLRWLIRRTGHWDHLVTIDTVVSREDAARLRAALRRQGVFCYLSGASLNRLGAGVPVRVQVDRQDADRVAELLRQPTELEAAPPPEGRGTEPEASPDCRTERA